MASEFSKDGKYFAQISTDGKLKIWNTLSNSFEQEFTPDFHLTSPCTCLQFLAPDAAPIKVGTTPRKKKRKDSLDKSEDKIALGTISGRLFVYSIPKANVEFTIDNENNGQSINCISSCDGTIVYSGAGNNVLVWNLQKRKIANKWVAGKEKIGAILVIPYSGKLLTASKNIKLWDVDTKEPLKTFTGHSSEVKLLQYVNPRGTVTDSYFISGSKGDRILNCWSLNENLDGKNAVAGCLMEDIIQNLSIHINCDGSTSLAASVRSGVVHIYKHTLNGKCGKPLKPKTTIQVVAEGTDPVTPISVTGAIYRDETNICIGYGNEIAKTFENIELSSPQKMQCLLRKDPQGPPKSTKEKDKQISKQKTPIVDNDVQYLTPQSSTTPSKRKLDGKRDLPMEKRLENLTLNHLDGGSKVPKSTNVAQLLVQGLQSKDKNILRTVLCQKDPEIVKNTVKRLPMPVIVPLLEELSGFVQGKTLSSQIGTMWLRNLISTHSGLLISNPDLPNLLGPALNSIETRLSLQTPLNRLKGRLDLLVAQVEAKNNQEGAENEEPLLVFNDKASNDSDPEMDFDDHSNSENEWFEDSSDQQESENEQVTENGEGGNDPSDDDDDDDDDDEMSS